MDKDLYKACMFAKRMAEDGMYEGLANHKAGRYYGFTSSEVGAARIELKEQYKRAKQRKWSRS